MKKWEYKRIQEYAGSIKQLDLILPKLGREGWEIISIVLSSETFSSAGPAYVHIFLKREIE